MNQEQRDTIDRIMNKADRQIWVTFQKEGIHCYPAASTDPQLATGDQYDVSFLGSPHRHIFHFRVGIAVYHNDRDIEFIQFKRWLENLYSGDQSVLQLNYKSCEMMSDEVFLWWAGLCAVAAANICAWATSAALLRRRRAA